MTKFQKRVALISVLIGAGFAIWFLEPERPMRASNSGNHEVAVMNAQEKAKQFEAAKEISTPDGFINVKSVSIEEHVGKNVVLVDFWTYSCINCQRTLPYLNAWHEKYADKGLVIIGVHTPEFAFEEHYDNVLAAVSKFDIKYPVVLDNDYSTWTAYRNRYWPRKYLVDIDGFIIYDHIGEGAYEETERNIQSALAERATRLGEAITIDASVVKEERLEAGAARTPEIYFGAARNERLAGGVALQQGLFSFTDIPNELSDDTLYLEGTWRITPEFAQNTSDGARIRLRYSAKNVFFVASADAPLRVTVLRDGKLVKNKAGEHVNNGMVTIREDGLYELIKDEAGGEHTLELIIESAGLRAFTFTFG